MTLLSPLFLLFGLTASVPLILHLYQQRKRLVMPFSTNRFFTESIIRSQRRLRLRRWFLLLLRVAACVLAALALAQPIVNLMGWAGFAGGRDVIVLLDDSLSMRAADRPGGLSHFDRARDMADQLLDRLQPHDRAAVVTFCGRVIGQPAVTGTVTTTDFDRLRNELRQLQPTLAAGNAPLALQHAAHLLSDAKQRARLAIVLTDAQRADWRSGRWPQPDHPVTATIVRLAPPTCRNLVADRMTLTNTTAVIGQPNGLRVRLVNLAPTTTNASLCLTVDGAEQVHRPIALTGQSSRTETLAVRFDTPGAHRLHLKLDVTDAQPADNDLFAVATVTTRLPVLIIDGQLEEQARQSGAFYLAAALRAISSDEQASRPDILHPADLAATDLDSYSVLLLSNVTSLPIRQVERLEHFVQRGGGLAIFPGPNIDRNFYNHTLAAANRPLGGLLPATFGDRVGSLAAPRPMHILQADLDHPILQRFSGPLRSALAGVSVYRAYALTSRQAWVIAAMDNALPFMVERSFGRGKVICFATDTISQWTNLPLRRVFIPLVNRTVSYLAGGGLRQRDHLVGRELTVLRGHWAYDKPAHVSLPDGLIRPARVHLVGAQPVAFLPAEQVRLAGFYQVQGESAPPDKTGSTGLFAVNAPRSESTTDTLDLAVAKNRAGRWRIQSIDLSDPARDRTSQNASLAALVNSGRVSRGIWDLLLWIVLFILLIEPIIANWRVGKKQAVAATPVHPATRKVA